MMRLLTSWIVGLYRVLMWIRYPADLRDRYGADMVADFRRLLEEEVATGGYAGARSTLLRGLRDLVRPLPGPTTRSPRSARLPAALEDLRFANRSLRREARFSIVLTGMLAVGIGLNVAVFSALNAYLLRPLPFPESERLYAVNAWGGVSWTEADEVLELSVSWDLDAFTIVGEPGPELVRGAWITPDFLTVYDVEPALGRSFTREDAGRDGEAVALVSHRLWVERFGRDPEILGRGFRAYMSDRPEEAEAFTIVGVLPEDFWYVNPYTELFVPIREERAVYTGRLRPDVTVDEAETALTRIAQPRVEGAGADFRVTLESLHEQYVAEVRPTLVVLQVAVLLVLLIACANAAVLLLVRTVRREGELGLRRALGAGRGRIARQLLFEGFLMAGAAATLGTALAWWAVDAVRTVAVARLGRSVPGGLEALTIDGSVLAATVCLTVVVGALFGLVPWIASGRGPLAALLGSAARSGDTRGRRRVRHTLVAAELALTLSLLMGAGLMVRSALHLQGDELGFVPEGVVRGEVGLRASSYPDPVDRHRFFDRFVQEVRAIPGVTAAGVTSFAPFVNSPGQRSVEGEGARLRAEAVSSLIGEGYLEAMGISLLRGRDVTADDAWGGEPVALVSESLARALWPGQDPLGRGVREIEQGPMGEPLGEPGPFVRVVGVVADVARGTRTSPEELYRPYQQASPLWMSIVARSTPGAPSVSPAIEASLRSLDAEAPLFEVTLLADAVTEQRAPTRFVAWLLGGFSAFALLLSIVGMYGVIAYAAQQQSRDIAVRIALGADRRTVTEFFLASGAVVAAVGVTLGSLGGLQLGRVLESQLHGVSWWDPLTHAVLAAALLLAAIAAIWIPARRAARQLPMTVLRGE